MNLYFVPTRFKLLIAFVVLTANLHAQFSISGGVQRQVENLFNNGLLTYYSKPTSHVYNGLALQGDYTINVFRLYSEIGYLKSDFHLTRFSSFSSGGGSSPYQNYTRTYHADVLFEYITLKIGLGSEFSTKFRKNWWGAFSYNIFFQHDRLNLDSESNHVMYLTTKFATLNDGIVTTEHPADYKKFDIIELEPQLNQIGLELKYRIGWKNYFLELSTALSMSDSYRTKPSYHSSNYEEQSSPWILNTGLKLGYLFNYKKKLKLTEKE